MKVERIEQLKARLAAMEKYVSRLRAENARRRLRGRLLDQEVVRLKAELAETRKTGAA